MSRSSWRRTVRTAARATLVGALALGGAACRAQPTDPPVAAGTAAYVAGSLEDELDHWLRRGYDDPTAARAQFDRWRGTAQDWPAAARRSLAIATAALAAAHDEGASMDAALQALQPAAAAGDALAQSAVALAQADRHETRGEVEQAARSARAALATLAGVCGNETDPPDPTQAGNGHAPAGATASTTAGLSLAAAAPPLPEGCDYRLAWQAMLIAMRASEAEGLPAAAEMLARQQWRLAQRARDPWRSAMTLGLLALMRAQAGEVEQGQRLLRHALQQAHGLGDATLQARLLTIEGGMAQLRGDARATREATERAIAIADRAGLVRVEAGLRANLSDVLRHAGEPALALDAAERALEVGRSFRDERLQRIALHNAGLARIALGRIDAGRADLMQLLEYAHSAGATGDEIVALREYGEALAAAGDARSALALFHQERALTSDVARRNREAALQAVQTRYDVQRKEREIALLSRDNALKEAALQNRTLTQLLWALGAAVLLLAATLAALLYRRARQLRAELELSHAQLRVQSERDPLTQLANRRHVQSVVQALGRRAPFSGALLMIDLDHFKRVNDRHGHPVGDQVLVEVARRLAEVVRHEDLVVRWGGEEFLVLSPGLPEGQLDGLAERVLAAFAERPFPLRDAPPLAVTASIGYARFPLPPHGLGVGWEQALKLVDMALYVAKSHGRNRSVGIEAADVADLDALMHAARDFDAASRDGVLRLMIREGPVPGAQPAAASPSSDAAPAPLSAALGEPPP